MRFNDGSRRDSQPISARAPARAQPGRPIGFRSLRIFAFLLAASLGNQPSARAEDVRIATKDGDRLAVVLAAPRRPAPTVIGLHGAGGSPQRMLRRSDLAEAAAKHGFAVVFPQGINGQWNDGREFRHSAVDDVGFLKRLAEELASRGIADPARLYMVGISNGGMMTFRMLCEASDLLAGAGTIIANMPESVGVSCRLKRPIPVIMFNGTADPLVPYKGGAAGFRGERGSVWGAERTAAFLAQSNGCGAPSEMLLPGGAATDAVRVVRLDWGACKSGRNVALYRVEGGGHQIFGRGEAFSAILGRGTTQISAPETIMAAFASLENRPQ